MQRCLRKLVTTHRVFHSHSLPKPPPPRIFASSLKHPLHSLDSWRSEHTVSVIFRRFHSGPVFARPLMFNSPNSLLRVSGGNVGRFRPKLLRAQFHGKDFDVNRSYRSYSGGWRSWFQGLTSNDLVLGLIIANAVVFLSWRVADEKFMSENFTISLHNVKCGRLHTLITNAFSHINVEHIISNMIGLYFFGTSIGRAFGPEYLLKLYLAGAVGGSVLYLAHQAYKAQTSKGWTGMDVSRQAALGASGAVNAIMLLNIFLFPRSTLCIDFIIPVPAALLGIFLIGKDVLRTIEGDSHISGSAHLGGAVVAAIAWARIRKGRF